MSPDSFSYRQSVQASIASLASFSLVTRNVNTLLSLHPLVHEWCRDRISEDEQQPNYRRALSLLSSSVNWGFGNEDSTFRRPLVSHVHNLLRIRNNSGELSEEDWMQCFPAWSFILRENGWTQSALQLMEEVVNLEKVKLGEDHPGTLSSMHNLVLIYSEAGQLSEALELMEEVLILQKRKLGTTHPDTLSSMYGLANLYSECG